jgi:UDPglucose 6-dehydrogenase
MQALAGADALVIITEWKEFRSPDFDEIAKQLKSKQIFDGRNMYEPSVVKRAGLKYHGIGRKSS